MTDKLTDSFTAMRFKENIPHRIVNETRRLTHEIQVESLDCVVDLLKEKLDATNEAYLRCIVDTLKEVPSHANFGAVNARTKKIQERFQPTKVNMCRSYTKENVSIHE